MYIVQFIRVLLSTAQESFVQSIEESSEARWFDAQWWRMALAQAKVKAHISVCLGR